jgi:hypothetical protein
VHNDDIEDVDEALEDVPIIHSCSGTTPFERPPLQLEHAEAARADVGAAREEIATDKRLEDTGLAAALAADDHDLLINLEATY